MNQSHRRPGQKRTRYEGRGAGSGLPGRLGGTERGPGRRMRKKPGGERRFCGVGGSGGKLAQREGDAHRGQPRRTGRRGGAAGAGRGAGRRCQCEQRAECSGRRPGHVRTRGRGPRPPKRGAQRHPPEPRKCGYGAWSAGSRGGRIGVGWGSRLVPGSWAGNFVPPLPSPGEGAQAQGGEKKFDLERTGRGGGLACVECRGAEVLGELRAVIGTDRGGRLGGESLAGRGRSGSGWRGGLVGLPCSRVMAALLELGVS